MFNSLKTISSNKLPSRLTVIASALLAMSNTSTAQENEVEEIIVTGEKIERSVQDTVSSVAVFNETQITESAIYDIQDVFARLANINTAEGNEGFSIRGINDRLVGAPGSSSLSSFHIDGAFIAQNGVQAGQSDLWDISQVEVFRGPQSTTQGRNSLAGAIFIKTNDPTYEPDGQLRVAFGEDNTQTYSIAYGDAIIEDQLAYRVSIDHQSTDGFIDNEFLDDDEYGDSSNTTVRGKLLFEPAAIDGLSILTTLSYSENEAGDIFASTIDADGNEIDPFDAKVFANIDGIENVDQTILTTKVDYEINDVWSFTSISSYNETEFERLDDDDRQAFGGEASRDRDELDETFTQEFRFNFETENTRGLIGAYYFNSEFEQSRTDITNTNINLQGVVASGVTATATNDLIANLEAQGLPEATINAIVAGAAPQIAAAAQDAASLYPEELFIQDARAVSRSIENYAIFGNIEYDLSNFITLSAGARYDVEEVDNVTNSDTIPFTVLPSPTDFDASTGAIVEQVNALITNGVEAEDLNSDTDFSAFLPKVGITLNWTDELATSFTIQRAYRAGGSGTTAAGNFEFDEEFTTNYDLSFRSRWLDNRLTVNANLFYVDWEDQQVQIIDQREGNNNFDLATVNVGESSLKGGELDVSWIASDILNLYASVGYVDTEFDSFDASFVDESNDLTGNEFNNAPKITASAGFSYDIIPSLKLQADINYQDESFDDPENESENDSRAIVNSKLTYHVNDNVEVALVARNLFDREFLLRNDEFDRNAVLIGQPRTVLLQLQSKF